MMGDSDMVPRGGLTAALSLLVAIEATIAEIDTVAGGIAAARRARALEELLRLADAQAELQVRATIARLRTARRVGELLLEMEKHPGGRPPEKGNPYQRDTGFPTLAGLGISRRDAANWQAIARLPGERFEEWIDAALARGHDLSLAGAVRFARHWAARHGEPQGDEAPGDDGDADAPRRFTTCPQCGGLGYISIEEVER